eukprot:jgi/Psemu1/204711/e_gw1.355.59.1
MVIPRNIKRRKISNAVVLSAIFLLVWTQQPQPVHLTTTAEKFEPYTLNGGLVSAVAGKNFAIIASDTRMIGEGGYLLESRNHFSPEESEEVRVIDLEDTTLARAPIWIGSSGCSTDCCQLQRTVRADIRAASYFGQIVRSEPDRVANMLSQTLYERRGFPYYAFCVVSGLDGTETDGGNDNNNNNNNNICGKAYVYDAIGSYERVAVAAAGTGRELLQPILDRMFTATSDNREVDGTANEAVEILCKAYRSVSEREIGVGDKLVLHVSEMKSNGKVCRRVFVVPLKEH